MPVPSGEALPQRKRRSGYHGAPPLYCGAGVCGEMRKRSLAVAERLDPGPQIISGARTLAFGNGDTRMAKARSDRTQPER